MNTSLLTAAASMAIVLAPAPASHQQVQWRAPQPAPPRAVVVAPRAVIPRPGRFAADLYVDYVASPRKLTVTRETFGIICPARKPSLACDPYTSGIYEAGRELVAGGYVNRDGARWWWVDGGVNIFGGHAYEWIDGRDVSG